MSVGNILLSFFIVLVVAFTITGTFIHNKIKSQSVEYITHKKTYKYLIENRDNSFNKLQLELSENKISISSYLAKYESINQDYKLKLKDYNLKKAKIKKEDAVLGYTGLKYFLLGVGSRFFALIIALFYFTSIIRNTYSTIYKKYFNLIISGIFVLVSSYWFSWSLIFKVNSIGEYDFEQWHQNLLLYIFPLVVLLSSYFLAIHNNNIEQKLTKKIYKVMGWAYELDEKGYIKEEKEEDFAIDRINLTDEIVL